MIQDESSRQAISLLITIGFFTTVITLGFALIGVVSYVIDKVGKYNQTTQLLLSFIRTKKPKTYNN